MLSSPCQSITVLFSLIPWVVPPSPTKCFAQAITFLLQEKLKRTYIILQTGGREFTKKSDIISVIWLKNNSFAECNAPFLDLEHFHYSTSRMLYKMDPHIYMPYDFSSLEENVSQLACKGFQETFCMDWEFYINKRKTKFYICEGHTFHQHMESPSGN